MTETQQAGEQKTALEREIDQSFEYLMSPLGGEPHVRERERAIAFMLAHPQLSHPRLLAALKAKPTALDAPVMIELLPAFGLNDSIPMLEEIMMLGAEIVSRSAGLALGRHPSKRAHEALLRGLKSPRAESIVGAAAGLAVQTSQRPCDALAGLSNHEDPIVRYHVIQAAAKLKCIAVHELTKIAAEDPDDNIRSLAANLLNPG